MQLWQTVPKWITNKISEHQCLKCKTPFKRENITGIGLRENNNTTSIFVEHQCEKCQHREFVATSNIKDGSTEEMCYILLEEIHKQRNCLHATKTRHTRKTGPISDAEVKEFLKFLDTASHNELIDHINTKTHDQK